MAINFTAPFLSQPDKVTGGESVTETLSHHSGIPFIKGSAEWYAYCGITTDVEIPDYPTLPEPRITCEEYVTSKFRDLPVDHQGGNCSNDTDDLHGNGAKKACEDLVNDFKKIKAEQRDERIKEAREEMESVTGGSGGGGTSASGGSSELGQGGVEINDKFYYIMGPYGLVKCYCDSRANTAPSDSGGKPSDKPSEKEKEAARRKFDEFMKDEEELKEREDACTPAQIKACSCFFVLVNIYDPVACGQCNPCRLYCRCISKFVGHYEYMFFDAGAAQSFAEGLRTPMNCCNNYACERVYKTAVIGSDAACADDACKVTPDDVDPNFPMGWCGPSNHPSPSRFAMGAGNFAKYYCSPSGPGFGKIYYRGD